MAVAAGGAALRKVKAEAASLKGSERSVGQLQRPRGPVDIESVPAHTHAHTQTYTRTQDKVVLPCSC